MTPEDLLDLWDRAASAGPRIRARVLATWSGTGDPDELARWPLGQVQAELLGAWRALCDAPVEAVADCPACGEMLELSIEPDALPVTASHSPRPVTDDNGREVAPRLVTSADLEAVAGLDHNEARRELVQRVLDVADPSPDVQRAVAAALEDADPASSWWVTLCCPECEHGWEEPLDLSAFLWHAVDAAAIRLLEEVTDLAATFGWSEAAVLALSPARRAAYLALAVR